jgi:hypothetical protein
VSAQGIPAATPLGVEVIEHLQEQIASGRRLLGSILAQGKAIREQDVEGVVSRLGDIKTEMEMRGRLEGTRTELLTRAGQRLGVPPAAVTLESLTTLMAPLEASTARERSAELRGLLEEITREHGINRALMRQELAFLDHLMRLVGGEGESTGYGPQPGAANPNAAPAKHRVLDLQA